jgi:predicted nucleotidyltransferase
MELKELIKNLARALKKNRIKYMIIGGQAVLIYGEPRMTIDIDITIGLDINGLEKLKKIIKELNLKIIPKNYKKFLEETMVLPTIDEKTKIRIDFIFSFSNYEKEALKRVKKIKVDEVKVNYASIEDLIIHKIIAGREKDLEDVKSILLKNKKINENYILKWLSEFESVLQENLIERFKKVKKEVKL